MIAHRPIALAALATSLALSTFSLDAQQRATPLDSTTLASFRWRSIGPADMGGRIADIVGIPSPSKTFYVATVAGGIWKTTNAGTTFRPLFDDQRVVSMGALAIAPSDTNQLWAGTGEQNSRNSISPGGGIYKSGDGGKTWKLMGLEKTQQIGRIVVHPTDPNIVYVAALGHVWDANPERGLYKTIDGGKSWQLIKFVSDKAGFVDVAMDPSNPDVLYASSYERSRGPYFLKSGGIGSALWKSGDAGKTWAKVDGGGFPETQKGRISVAISRSNPGTVYALVEADSVRGATHALRAPSSDSAGEKPKAPIKQRLLSGLYRSEDAGKTWRWMNDVDVRPFYYSQVRVDPKLSNRVYWSSTPFNFSDDGGKTVRNGTVGIHVDHHAMWTDPNDPEHFIVGDDGGVSQTWDRGGNYEFLNRISIGQFYEVSYDMAVPYRVCGGLQDNGSWCGPSRKRGGPITNTDWFTVGGGDGFYTAQDQSNPNIIYAESQGGNIRRLDYSTGESKSIVKPTWRPRYLQNEDSILVARGDTAKPVPATLKKRLAELQMVQQKDSTDLDLRFNWNTPYFVSPHAPSTIYIGGNRVLKSTNRGDDVLPISPDLSTRDMAKVRWSMDSTGGITNDATGAETYGTITTLAESYMRPGLLFAGTDDGNVWLTRNDGATWDNISTHFPGVPPKTYVVRIEPSHFDTATFYVAFENHRVNDFAPYLYVTTDFGKTFRSIVNDLPKGGPDFLHVIREDPVNRDLLYAGTDVGAFISRDRGQSWQKFMTGLPTVPVHDLKIQPRDHELIAATHGRGIWIADVAALEQLKDSIFAKGTYLFAPKTAYAFVEAPGADISSGQSTFKGQSAPFGADIMYRLTSGSPKDTVKLVITNVKGDTLKTLMGRGGAGVHHATWDLKAKPPTPTPLTPAGRRDSLITARKLEHVFDSLETAGVAPKAVLETVREHYENGTIGELFQRAQSGGGGGGRFAERPGESPLPKHDRHDASDSTKKKAGAAAASAEGGAEGEEGAVSQEVLSQVSGAVRASKALPGGGFGGGGRNTGLVESGDYLVTMTVGGATQRQVLRVEKAAGTGSSSASDDDDDDPFDP
jgi:Sortilin, neurotensin receptor 3,